MMIDLEMFEKIYDLLFEYQNIAKKRGLNPQQFRILLHASLALLARIRSEAYDIPYDKVIEQETTEFDRIIRLARELPIEAVNQFMPPKYRK